MSLSRLSIHLSRVSGPVLDYLKGMAGREVRARVTRGADPGGVALLRLGGRILEARVQGTSLQTGTDLFVRVKSTGGVYNLVVLSGGGPTPGAPAAAANLPAGMLAAFLGFLSRSRVSAEPGKRQAEKPAVGTVSARLELNKTAPELRMSLEPLLDLLDRSPDLKGVFFEEWLSGAGASGEGAGEQAPDAEDGRRNAAAGAAPGPGVYFLRLELSQLGAVGVLFVSTAPAAMGAEKTEEGRGNESAFERMNIYLAAENRETDALLQERVDAWLESLRELIPGLGELAVLPPDGAPRSGGLDFKA